MLIPLRPGELQRLIPAVATSNQFTAALGNPRKILQRVLISTIGGVITLLISQTLSFNRWGSVWLVAGVALLLYILWGPILEAGQRNAALRRYPAAALFDGEVAEAYTRERVENRREQADQHGDLELVEQRRTWMVLELADGSQQTREIQLGGGFMSFDAPQAHFGLGAAAQATALRILWPGGGESRVEGPLEAGRLYHIRRTQSSGE